LPAVVIGLIAAVAATCFWAAYREVEATLVRAGGDRAAAAADQIGGLFERSVQQSQASVRQMATNPDIREYLQSPTDATRERALARLGTLMPTGTRRVELWNDAGARVLEIASQPPADPSSGAALPPPAARPEAVGITPFQISGNTVFSDSVSEISSGQPGTSSRLGFLLVRGTFSVSPPDALNRLVGRDAVISVGNQSGGTWTDLSKVVPAPPRDLTKRGIAEYKAAAGDRRIGALSPIRGTPWAVWVEFPRATLVAPAGAFLRRMAWTTLALLAMATVLIAILSRRITTPLYDVAEAADAIAAGDYSRRTSTARLDEIGRVSRAFNAMTDQVQTIHKQLADEARALRNADAGKSAILNGALDCIVTMDHLGNIVEFNPAAESTFGFSREEAVGRPLADLLIPTVLRDQHRKGLARYLETGAGPVIGKRIEITALRKDGNAFPAELAIVVIALDDAPKFTGFLRDLTIQKSSEEARLRSVQIEQENKRAQEANRLKSEFLANMSHELRTPLNAIIGFAELMHDGKVGPVSGTHKEYLGDIVTSSRHLLQLVNDVLDLAKVESGKMDFRPEPVDVEKLTAEVRSILRELAGSKRIRIETSVHPDVTGIVADPARVKQILYNYLSNALKFTPDGGTVTVRIEPEGDAFFRIDVGDTGVGIAEQDISQLFMEFHQLDAGLAKKYQGTGLGLALTRQLAEAQGGHVAVRSTMGVGSTFSAVLPRVMNPTSRADATLAPTKATFDPARTPTVLIVDDDSTALKLADATLRQAGLRVVCANSVEDGLNLATFDPPTVVVVDLLMPRAGGFEFIERFRREPYGVNVPIVVWTVKDLTAQERDRLHSLAAGLVLKRDGGAATLLVALRQLVHIESLSSVAAEESPRSH
jgi:PAS domain S-box-containing protein